MLYQLVRMSGADAPKPKATGGALYRKGLPALANDDGALSGIAGLGMASSVLMDQPETIRSGLSDLAVKICEHAARTCGDAYLVGSQVLFNSTSKLLKEGKFTPKEFRTRVDELQNVVEEELEKQAVFRLVPEYRRYFEDQTLFGQEVAERFPEAKRDIAEAGCCLALWRATASVFHVMRVMEVGLKAIAKPLGIPYAPSWESYLTQITNNIAQPHKRKPKKWRKLEPFFREILGDLQAVKVAWRNPTMHIVRTYNVVEAEEIFKAVRTLMVRIATELPNDAKKKAAA